MEILSYPIGLLVGLFPIAVALGPSQAPAHLLLDSRPVCELTARSPGCMVDLGRDPRVHLLELLRTDAAGHVTERVRRWINRPGIEPEILAAANCDEAKKKCDFDLTWAHPERLEPTRVDIAIDGRSVWHGKDRKVSVPMAVGAKPQLVVADAVFPDGTRATFTRTLYAYYPEEAQAALQAVPILPAEGSGTDEEIAAKLRAAGRTVRIVEETQPALTFVLETGVFEKVPDMLSVEPWGTTFRRRVHIQSPTGVVGRETPIQIVVPDESLSAFSTTAERIGRRAPLSSPHWSRVADAVAAAGYDLGGSPRRRAVVLVLGGFDRPTVSSFSAAQARAYLDQVMVPLEVWRIGAPDIAPEWGPGRLILTREDLQLAFAELGTALSRQRIAWLEGSRDTRPSGAVLAPGIALAGRTASAQGLPALPIESSAAAAPPPSTGPDGGAVHALAAAADGTVVYAGTHAGVFRSRDGGARWEGASAGLPGAPVRSLVVEPARPETVFAGTDAGLYRTADGGASWRAAGDARPASALALGPDAGGRTTLYVGTSGAGVRRSDDGGRTLLETALDHGDARAIAVDARDGSVFAATDEGVFRSPDRGATWSPAGSFVRPVLALAFGRESALYAATAGDGLFVTTDSGANWKRTALASTYLTSVTTDGPGGGLLAGSPDGIFSSSGARWTLARLGAIESLASVRAAAWIAGGSSGIQRADSTRRWSDSNSGLTARSVLALGGAPGAGPGILAATPGGLFQTTDGGWKRLPGTPAGSAWNSIAVGSTPSPELIVGSSGEIGRSFGLGEGWSWKPTPAVFGLAADPAHPGPVYAATRGGILRSEDGGLSWQASSDGMAKTFALGLALDSVEPSTVYAATAGAGVFRSTNSGHSWKAGGRELAHVIVRCVAPGAGAAEVVYAGTDGGVFGSTNGGRSWTALTDGLPRAPVYALAGDAAAPSTLYAGTSAGLFITFDAGRIWNALDDAAIPAPITALWIDSERKTLVVGTLGAGVFEIPLAR